MSHTKPTPDSERPTLENLRILSDEEIIKRQKRREKIFEQIQQECIRQDMKWGDQSHDDGKWLQILIEELGEQSADSLDGNPVEAKRELVQSAAVLVQWIYDAIRRTDN